MLDRYDTGGDDERSRLTWTLRPFLEQLQREGKDADAVLRSAHDCAEPDHFARTSSSAKALFTQLCRSYTSAWFII